jgi:hypothetical protein
MQVRDENLQNLSTEKSEIIVRCGVSWDDINWILKTEDVMMFSRLYWDSRGF